MDVWLAGAQSSFAASVLVLQGVCLPLSGGPLLTRLRGRVAGR